MVEKRRLKREIKKQKKLIEGLEKKRLRSQAALMQAIVEDKEPSELEVDYFNSYSEMIESERKKLRDLLKQQEDL